MSWFSRSDTSSPAQSGRSPAHGGYGQVPGGGGAAPPAPPPRHAAVPPAYRQPAYEAYSQQSSPANQYSEKRYPSHGGGAGGAAGAGQGAGGAQYHLPSRPSGGRGQSQNAGGRFSVVEAPSPSHALSNRIVLAEQDFGGTPYVTIKGQFIYATMSVPIPSLGQIGTMLTVHHACRFDPKVAPGTIGASRLVRQFAGLSQSGDVVDVEPFDPFSLGSDIYLSSLDLEVSQVTAVPEKPCLRI